MYHLLVPVKKEGDWYKLKWKPIKGETYNLFIINNWASWKSKWIGIVYTPNNAHNGWGRFYDGIRIQIGFLFFEIHFWIKYNISCIEKSPADEHIGATLDFSKSNLK